MSRNLMSEPTALTERQSSVTKGKNDTHYSNRSTLVVDSSKRCSSCSNLCDMSKFFSLRVSSRLFRTAIVSISAGLLNGGENSLKASQLNQVITPMKPIFQLGRNNFDKLLLCFKALQFELALRPTLTECTAGSIFLGVEPVLELMGIPNPADGLVFVHRSPR